MKTVGEILRAARREKNWDIGDLSSRTKIQERFLVALEESDYEHLPEAAFVKGFIQTTSVELGLKPDAMVAIFRRDFGVDKKGNIIPRELEEIGRKGFRWTPALTTMSVLAVVIVAFVGYLAFQLHLFVSAPALTVTLPKDQSVVSQEVLVEGRTDPSATLSINGQEIKKNRNGVFSQTVMLSKGEHTISVAATGQNGKTTTIERTVQVKSD